MYVCIAAAMRGFLAWIGCRCTVDMTAPCLFHTHPLQALAFPSTPVLAVHLDRGGSRGPRIWFDVGMLRSLSELNHACVRLSMEGYVEALCALYLKTCGELPVPKDSLRKLLKKALDEYGNIFYMRDKAVKQVMSTRPGAYSRMPVA